MNRLDSAMAEVLLDLEDARRRRSAALAAGWDLDGDLAAPAGRSVPDWVEAALGRFPEDIAGAVFAWREEPCRVVFARTAAGELYGLTSGPDPLPDPPPFLIDSPWERPSARRRRPPAPADRRRRRG